MKAAEKERPILFSAPMVRALLDGSKTQTRRIVKQLDPEHGAVTTGRDGKPMGACWAYGGSVIPCPYGQPGERLWVRETWAPHPDFLRSVGRTVYRADPECEHDVARWYPSIHMRREYSRILLEVTAVRVERLQDISEADAIAEGCTQPACGPDWKLAKRWAYRELWESINGADSWAANPWVWVIEFKRVAPALREVEAA